MPQIRVAVLSEDRLLCEGLSHIIGAVTGLAMVRAEQAASEVAARAAVDVLLLDSRMPAALELCSALKRDVGPLVILFMSSNADEGWAVDALAAGARGILARDARAEDLVKAIRVVHDGQIWARRQTIEAWVGRMAGRADADRVAVLEHGLSTREKEVFRHAASGLSNRELAGRLAISEATVKVHLTHIFQKLGVRGRAELAAAYHGLIATGPDRDPAGSILRSPA